MSPIVKWTTSLLPPPPPGGSSHDKRTANDWENHPSLIAGVEALEAYQTWVSGVVLPIAFAWIDDHYDEVYGKLTAGGMEALKDDVGVVIAAAFELVRETEEYKEGQRKLEEYREKRKQGTLPTQDLNPVWTRITKEVRQATHGIFQAEKPYLDDTV